eukprot:TRINITY_DN2468_c0_g1_i1.p1 TRINITY_DN2468_c0_g1~~TRINITY_DN2468_c0_g1_i1.p1  ORF type:complete len:981 (+),score=257.64 TRINITY_DN2468_c0_g1_i1:86-3028(+)
MAAAAAGDPPMSPPTSAASTGVVCSSCGVAAHLVCDQCSSMAFCSAECHRAAGEHLQVDTHLLRELRTGALVQPDAAAGAEGEDADEAADEDALIRSCVGDPAKDKKICVSCREEVGPMDLVVLCQRGEQHATQNPYHAHERCQDRCVHQAARETGNRRRAADDLNAYGHKMCILCYSNTKTASQSCTADTRGRWAELVQGEGGHGVAKLRAALLRMLTGGRATKRHVITAKAARDQERLAQQLKAVASAEEGARAKVQAEEGAPRQALAAAEAVERDAVWAVAQAEEWGVAGELRGPPLPVLREARNLSDWLSKHYAPVVTHMLGRATFLMVFFTPQQAASARRFIAMEAAIDRANKVRLCPLGADSLSAARLELAPAVELRRRATQCELRQQEGAAQQRADWSRGWCSLARDALQGREAVARCGVQGAQAAAHRELREECTAARKALTAAAAAAAAAASPAVPPNPVSGYSEDVYDDTLCYSGPDSGSESDAEGPRGNADNRLPPASYAPRSDVAKPSAQRFPYPRVQEPDDMEPLVAEVVLSVSSSIQAKPAPFLSELQPALPPGWFRALDGEWGLALHNSTKKLPQAWFIRHPIVIWIGDMDYTQVASNCNWTLLEIPPAGKKHLGVECSVTLSFDPSSDTLFRSRDTAYTVRLWAEVGSPHVTYHGSFQRLSGDTRIKKFKLVNRKKCGSVPLPLGGSAFYVDPAHLAGTDGCLSAAQVPFVVDGYSEIHARVLEEAKNPRPWRAPDKAGGGHASQTLENLPQAPQPADRLACPGTLSWRMWMWVDEQDGSLLRILRWFTGREDSKELHIAHRLDSMRVDDADGNTYARRDFVSEYGDDARRRWEAAARPPPDLSIQTGTDCPKPHWASAGAEAQQWWEQIKAVAAGWEVCRDKDNLLPNPEGQAVWGRTRVRFGLALSPGPDGCLLIRYVQGGRTVGSGQLADGERLLQIAPELLEQPDWRPGRIVWGIVGVGP